MRKVEHPGMLVSRATRMTASEQTIQQGGDGQLPDLPTFGKLISPSTPRHGSIAKLHAALMACRPGADADERVDAIERLVAWLRSKANSQRRETPSQGRPSGLAPAPPRGGTSNGARVPRAARFHLGTGDRRKRARRFVRPTRLAHRSRLPCRDGRPRLATVLPEPHDPRDLLQLVARMFPSEIHRRALVGMPPEPVLELTQLLRDATELDPWAAITVHLQDACALLATRISAVGLSDVIRARSPAVRLAENPFFRLPRSVDALLDAVRRGGNVQLCVNECRALIAECRRVSEAVVDNLEKYGVSIDVVYRVELIGRA